MKDTWIQEHHRKIELLARTGMASKAVVYGTIGGLALQVALSAGGQIQGKSGALKTLAGQPFGQFLLAALIVGFLGYALWRMIQGFYNTDSESNDIKGLGKRGASIIRGVTYSALAVATTRLLVNGSGGSSAASKSEQAMNLPMGSLVLGLVAMGILVAGMFQFYKVIKGKYKEHLNLNALSGSKQKLLNRAAQMGLSARGVVFCVIAFFLAKAALSQDGSQARGIGGALESLSQQPYGTWVLGTIASGLVLFAIYEAFKAWYMELNF